MKLTSFYSAISSVICLFCLAGTVRGADLSPNTPDIERNKISAVAIEVSPSANDTFRITAKHAWKMTPGVYRKGHF